MSLPQNKFNAAEAKLANAVAEVWGISCVYTPVSGDPTTVLVSIDEDVEISLNGGAEVTHFDYVGIVRKSEISAVKKGDVIAPEDSDLSFVVQKIIEESSSDTSFSMTKKRAAS